MEQNYAYNRLLEHVADPFIFRWAGKYYLFCTGDFVPVFVSENLTDWEKVGTAITPEEGNEDILNCYAPEVTYFGGKFYMCFSPAGNKHRLFVSDNLTNGYVPLTDKRFDGIDGSFYLKNGKFILTRTANIKQRKNKDGIYLKKTSSAEKLASYKGWKRIPQAFLNGWTEGPFINERNGYEYLTFTGNHFLSRGYRISYCYKKENSHTFKQGKTLLISTKKDFYGLGHSSTATAPDLDGRIIAYHDLILDEKGDYAQRNFNLASLISDGKNLFVNPSLDYGDTTEITCFTEKDFLVTDTEYVLPINSPERYSAEITFKNSFPVTVKIGDNALFCDNGVLRLNKLKKRVTPVKADAYSVLKIENGRKSKIYLNGQKVFVFSPMPTEKIVFIGSRPLNATISPHAENSSDKSLIKAVPSRFTARSCNENVKETTIDEVNYVKGELTYSVNVLKSGNYCVIINALSEEKSEISVTTQGKTVNGVLEKCHGRKVLGFLPLEKGQTLLKIATQALICDLDLSSADNLTPDNTFLEKTAIDNYKVFLNDADLYDYSVKIQVNPSIKKYSGGVMLRASDYSYFDNQRKESYFGYLLSCYNGKVFLYKVAYGKKLIASGKIGKDENLLEVTLVNDEIKVFANGKRVISYMDDDAYFHGKTGILSLKENPDYKVII